MCVCMARDSFGLSLPSSKEFKPRVVEIGITTSPSDHPSMRCCVCGRCSFVSDTSKDHHPQLQATGGVSFACTRPDVYQPVVVPNCALRGASAMGRHVIVKWFRSPTIFFHVPSPARGPQKWPPFWTTTQPTTTGTHTRNVCCCCCCCDCDPECEME
jgi:hypothetical protein